MTPFTPPKFELPAFHCPHCNAYAFHEWQRVAFWNDGGRQDFAEFMRAECAHCQKYSLWLEENIIYPEATGVQLPNPDLEESIKADYLEARSIVEKSARGAVALLRLCIQKICKQLGERGDNINDDIKSLVRKGLAPQIQQSLDFVRVVGNNAVHPGQIDLKDDRDTAYTLFRLINLIADMMITQPKEVETLYQSLPPSSLNAINKRDK